MSRSGYSDDLDSAELNLWRGAVQRAIEGKRGQALLRDILAALDAMPEKELYAGSFQTADGEFCTLGAVARMKGIDTSDLGDEEDCSPAAVAHRFGVARALAAEIMYLNDEQDDDREYRHWVVVGPMPKDRWGNVDRHERSGFIALSDGPQRRFARMRRWVVEHIKAELVAQDAGGVA